MSALGEAEILLARKDLDVSDIQERKQYMSMFIEAKKYVADMDACEQICGHLLSQPDINVNDTYNPECCKSGGYSRLAHPIQLQ